MLIEDSSLFHVKIKSHDLRFLLKTLLKMIHHHYIIVNVIKTQCRLKRKEKKKNQEEENEHPLALPKIYEFNTYNPAAT